MIWHRPLSDYEPLSLRGIYCFKAIISALFLLSFVLFLNLPSASAMICAAPMFMMAPDRSFIRDVYWQIPIGFFGGVFFGLVAINLIGVYLPIAIGLMILWNLFWVYLSETGSVLRIPCRIISVLPLGFLLMAGSGQPNMISQIMLLLLGLVIVGIWGFVLIDHLLFPIEQNFPKRPPVLNIINHYFQTLRFNLLSLLLALRTTLSVLVILFANYMTGLPNLSVMVSAVVSAVVVSTPLSDKLKSSLNNRMMGTFFGAILGCCFIFLLAQFPFTWLMIFCFIFGVGLISYLAQKNMGFASMGMQAGVAFMATFLPGTDFSLDPSSGLTRLLGIVYGCLVAYLMSQAIRITFSNSNGSRRGA